ncbi:zinc finger protein 260-like isoform X2 [Lutzomyia longipalpis]|uniref:zinc finger protein 260-like isoform X2 n=1 Tax=Lutzomyia longipalpis TaxID=7200 RepID=UPI0024835324|nr:zinc finger protein 260-like isoform X2 [Lutzomyia longipalpis]
MEFRASENPFRDVIVKEECTEELSNAHGWKKAILEDLEDISERNDEKVSMDPLLDDDDIPCKFCRKRFVSQHLLELHMATHTRIKVPCSICSKAFFSDIALGNHIKSSHECEECGEMFKCRAEVQSHQWQIHREIVSNAEGSDVVKPVKRAITCQTCGKAFRHKCFLKKHLEDGCRKKKVFKCRHCPQMFAYQKARKNHISKRHPRQSSSQKDWEDWGPPKNVRNFSCSSCQDEFKNREQLNEHIRKTHHNRDKSLEKTKSCEKDLKQPFKYERHAEAHAKKDEENLQCPHCGKTYKNTTNLDRHMRKYCRGEEATMYSGKVYTCPICGWIGTVAREFLVHIRKHNYSIEIPSPIPLAQQKNQKMHEIFQNTLENFSETQEVYQESNYVKEENFTEEDFPNFLNCPHCPEIFDQEDLLEEHIEKVHKKLLIQLNCIKKETTDDSPFHTQDILGE